jgi:phosphonoacetate hydrolase
MVTKVIVCLDGVSPEYIKEANTPFLDSLAREGTSTVCDAMVPTVTNINNTSIMTASFPETHGITTNYYYDLETGEEVYMDSSKYLTCKTILEKATLEEKKTLLLTVKDKLRRLLARNISLTYSVEKPTNRIVTELGKPPDIYTAESSIWLIEAVNHELNKREWDYIYISTTDYIPHKFSPKETEAKEYLSKIDSTLESINEKQPLMGIVADHGMNPKKINLDPSKLLKEQGIENRLIANIKDEHITHHLNLGGSAYIYLKNNREIKATITILEDTAGVEKVFTRNKAAEKYKLNPERIGDILILADERHTLGPNSKSIYQDINIRSHGSLHERKVPLITNRQVELRSPLYNNVVIPLIEE